MFHYHEKETFTEAFEFILYMAKRLKDSGNEILSSVGATYSKWAAQIANGTARNQAGRRYTNSTAENDNNHLKTIIKAAYGYRSFDRFRKRALIIITYK
ncbi:MAG: transposase [Erysipelotrichaceae bacterium]|nr:transposase [Erysipelotrichaceae bacterium]